MSVLSLPLPQHATSVPDNLGLYDNYGICRDWYEKYQHFNAATVLDDLPDDVISSPPLACFRKKN